MRQMVPQLVAHRGLMARYPENSLEGVTAALNAGARYVEFDIQSLADGSLVLFHDRTMIRTTGKAGDLFELTPADLETFDANEPGRLGDRFSAIRIPTLSSLVDLLLDHPGSIALAEIKSESLQWFGVAPVMGNLLELLRPILDRTVIISFHTAALEYIRTHRPACMTGLILKRYDEERHGVARRLVPEILILSKQLLKPDARLWSGKWKWMVYDVTDPELALEYARSGVELIETADIAAMLAHPLLGANRLARGN